MRCTGGGQARLVATLADAPLLSRMKKKKKPNRKLVAPAETDALDEIEALRAIYGDAFQLAPDGSAFSILVKTLDGGSDAAGDARVSTPAVRLVRGLRRLSACSSLRAVRPLVCLFCFSSLLTSRALVRWSRQRWATHVAYRTSG